MEDKPLIPPVIARSTPKVTPQQLHKRYGAIFMLTLNFRTFIYTGLTPIIMASAMTIHRKSQNENCGKSRLNESISIKAAKF